MFTVMTKHPQAARRLSLAALFFSLGLSAFAADPLEAYVAAPDPAFKWELKKTETTNGFTTASISMTSQTWRTSTWTHAIQLVRPVKMRHPEIALIFVSGDGSGRSYLPVLAKLASEAGATAALLSKVPNQPLYGGKKEDALIAYTFLQYMKEGDDTWPALLPMVKSAVRAMDTVQAYSQKEHGEKVEKFVVTGASKRGWTTWLTAAVDKRVGGIAPMVIDMLNMKAQTDWAQKAYGKQSEQIQDYTELNLVENMDHPRMVKLRGFVDPYSYRSRYKMPKLILLGTNDPYWVVDSLRHYWDDLPEPKLVFQTPNAGHNLNGGFQAIETLAAFYQMIADGEQLPTMEWDTKADGQPQLKVKVNRPAKAINLWSADSSDRDFRNDKWSSKSLPIKSGSSVAEANVEKPASGYRAFMGEVVLTNRFGHEYKLSTEVQVIPDEIVRK